MGDHAFGPVDYDDAIPLDDEDIDLLEDDVRVGVQDGIPFIDFSERVRDIATKSLEFALVLSVLGRRVGYSALYNRLLSIWKPSKPIKLIDIENHHFLVKFSSRSDYISALTDGPWTIFGHYITVEPWSHDFGPSQSHPSRIMAWVRLPGLPITWYKRSLIEAIGSCIGSVVKVDYQTDYGRRGRFARMAVKINLTQPLVSKISINGRTQIFEYESLPVVCFNCGIYGHVNEHCPKTHLQEQAPGPDTNMREVPAPEPLDAYGPWMLVENRRRRPASVSKQPSRLDTAQFVSQSRFNPIFAESNPTTHSPVIADTLGNEPVAPASHPRHDDMLQTSAANNIIAHPSVAYGPSTSKSTNNGRAPVVIRKTSQAVLKPRDTNISLKKTVGVNVRAGAAKKSSLNPAKHSVIVTSELADPIILHRLNPKQLPSPLIADSRADPPVTLADPPSADTRKQTAGPMAMNH
ncbi:hypothetical protein V6N12_004991 [Hibiscus sabdariffa]